MANEIYKIREAVQSQLLKTDEVIASNEAIAEELANIEAELAYGFSVVAKWLQDLCSTLDRRFQEMIDILNFQSEMLKAIKEILERPLDTQAKELRKRAEVAYLNNWIDEAERDLLEAEKKNYQDFVVYHILGNIYLYHKTNYKRALEYYQKSAKYATPFSKEYAGNALLYVAMVYYKLGQLADAYNSTKRALELMPNDPHFLYHYAKYAAKNGSMSEFLKSLRECVYKDPKYLIIADADDMFFDVKEKIKELAICLRDEKKQVVENLSKEIVYLEAEAKTERVKELPFLKEQRKEIIKLSARNSYLDFLKAEEIAQNVCGKILSSIHDKLKKKHDELKLEGPPLGKGYIMSVLTVLIAMGISEEHPGFFWGIFLLLIAPVTVFFGGILSILHILGVEIPDWTTGADIVFLSGLILTIFWIVLDWRRKLNRLNALYDKVKKIEEKMLKYNIKSPNR